MPDSAPPPAGHNAPPADANPLLTRLNNDFADLLKRRDDLLGGAARAPTVIEDEDTAGKMADFVQKQIDPFLKKAKAVHEAEKEPFLSAGRTVDGFWHTLIDNLEKAKIGLNKVRKAYADKKADEERRRREEEARAAAAEAARLRREAEEAAARLAAETELPAAIAAEDTARQAEAVAVRATEAAAAKPAEMGRSRGAHGGMTTLREFWNFADLDRDAIDLEALRSHLPADALEKAVRSWITANKDALAGPDGKKLAGVRVFADTRI